MPYIPGDTLALSLGGSKSLDAITLDQVRRFTETARLPLKPVCDVVMETVERTANAWKSLPQQELLPSDIRTLIDAQIRKVTTATRAS